MNNDNFLIESSVLEQAQSLCAAIKDDKKRNIAIANVYAAILSEKYFMDIEVDSLCSLCRIPKISEEYEISDIYLKDNYIDVRLYTDNSNIVVPKKHFDFDILPVAYMFIKVSSDLSGAIVAGFIFPENIDKSKMLNNYYVVDESEMVSFYDVESRLTELGSIDLPDNYEKMILDFISQKKELSKDLLNILVKSNEARKFLADANNAFDKLALIDYNAIETENNDFVDEGNSLDDELEPAVSITDDFAVADMAPDISFESQGEGSLDMVESGDLLAAEEGLLDDAGSESLVLSDEEPLSLEEDSYSEFTDTELQPVDENSENLTEYNMEPDNNVAVADDIDIVSEDSSSDIQDFISDYKENGPISDFTDLVDADNASADVDIIGDISEPVAESSNEDTVEVEANDDVSNDFDYSTEITPSLNSIETMDTDSENFEITEDMLDYVSENSNGEIDNRNVALNTDGGQSDDQINTLFEEETPSMNLGKNKKKKSPLGFIVLMAAVAGLGYFAYNKFMPMLSEVTMPNEVSPMNENSPSQEKNTMPAEEAMPVESVENPTLPEKTEEGTAVSIPAIEQNLDASILVSNLTVNWEVPSSYTANNTAKRYFVKIGKILQLRLKTELLLLSKPPITNKITIELEYNKSNQRFAVKQLTASSGEKSVDDIILSTVKTALDTSFGMNMSVFENLQGNPVLVVKL